MVILLDGAQVLGCFEETFYMKVPWQTSRLPLTLVEAKLLTSSFFFTLAPCTPLKKIKELSPRGNGEFIVTKFKRC